jgi:hypothetical protein
VAEDGEQIRVFLNDIIGRFIKPENVLVPMYEEGDVVMSNDWVRPSPLFTLFFVTDWLVIGGHA